MLSDRWRGIHVKGQRVVSESSRHEVRHGVLLNHHIPLVRQLLDRPEGSIGRARISGEERDRPLRYVTTCHLLLDSVQAY